MTELLVSPPPADAIAAMVAVPGTQISPSILAMSNLQTTTHHRQTRRQDGGSGTWSPSAIVISPPTTLNTIRSFFSAGITDGPPSASVSLPCSNGSTNSSATKADSRHPRPPMTTDWSGEPIFERRIGLIFERCRQLCCDPRSCRPRARARPTRQGERIGEGARVGTLR